MDDEQSRVEGVATRKTVSLLSLLGIFLKLGCTSFGGPVAHIGYFRTEFVERRRWVDDGTYADLVALCNFLPGPASSQVGISLGVLKGGIAGGLMAWLGFTLPSALLMIAFAGGYAALGFSGESGALHGLKIVAVAVIAQAVWGMGRTLCPDRFRATLAILSAAAMLMSQFAWAQIAIIVAGALIGRRWIAADPAAPQEASRFGLSRRTGALAWLLLIGLLVLLPVAAAVSQNGSLAVFDSFFRVGSLVFGGGHVVLPLLHHEVVAPGWVGNDAFLAGYGAAQALPGPLFTFSAYLGSVMSAGPGGVAGGLWALLAMFLPALLLVIGALPWWETLRRRSGAQSALKGVNAAVVGLLVAALYDPVWTASIRSGSDFAVALAAFGALVFWKISPLYVAIATALVAALLAALVS